jgi:hypothetical protein
MPGTQEEVIRVRVAATTMESVCAMVVRAVAASN